MKCEYRTAARSVAVPEGEIAVNKQIIPAPVLVAGDDLAARRLHSTLVAEGVPVRMAPAISSSGGAAAPITPEQLHGSSWVCLGGNLADSDGSISRSVIAAGSAAGLPVSWNPGPDSIRRGAAHFHHELKMLRLLVLNYKEVIPFCRLKDGVGPVEALFHLAAFCGRDTIIVMTNGKQPALSLDARGERFYVAPSLWLDRLAQGTGAGDAYHASLVAALVRLFPLPRALDSARRSAAGALAVAGAEGPAPQIEALDPRYLEGNSPWLACIG